MIAAERTGRCARLIELDPYYVDAAVSRWARLTGGTPQHVKAEPSPDVAAHISEQTDGLDPTEPSPTSLSHWGIVL